MNDLTDRTKELTKEAATFAKDAVYIAVGLGVLGFQKLQAERVNLQKRVPQLGITDERLADLRAGMGRQVRQLDEFVGAALGKVETSLQPLEEQLPSSARDLASKAHATARQLHGHVSKVLSSVA
jgi:hypothetical protein